MIKANEQRLTDKVKDGLRVGSLNTAQRDRSLSKEEKKEYKETIERDNT